MKKIPTLLWALALATNVTFADLPKDINSSVAETKVWVHKSLYYSADDNFKNLVIMDKLLPVFELKRYRMVMFLNSHGFNQWKKGWASIVKKDFDKFINIVYNNSWNAELFKNIWNINNADIKKIDDFYNKDLEWWIDIIFWKMFNWFYLDNLLTYMKEIEDKYAYDNTNFIKNKFDINDYMEIYNAESFLKPIINKIENIKNIDDIIKNIDDLKISDVLLIEEQYNSFSNEDRKNFDYFLQIIQKKLKQLYVK